MCSRFVAAVTKLASALLHARIRDSYPLAVSVLPHQVSSCRGEGLKDCLMYVNGGAVAVLDH